jgi:hypothetical protein
MALEGGEGSASRPAHSLLSGKTRYPLYRRLGGPQDWPGQVQKILLSPGFDPRTLQPVASRYTDWATGPTCRHKSYIKSLETKGHQISREVEETTEIFSLLRDVYGEVGRVT